MQKYCLLEFLYSISVFSVRFKRFAAKEMSGTVWDPRGDFPPPLFLSTSAAYAGGGSYKKDKQLHTMCFMSL